MKNFSGVFMVRFWMILCLGSYPFIIKADASPKEQAIPNKKTIVEDEFDNMANAMREYNLKQTDENGELWSED